MANAKATVRRLEAFVGAPLIGAEVQTQKKEQRPLDEAIENYDEVASLECRWMVDIDGQPKRRKQRKQRKQRNQREQRDKKVPADYSCIYRSDQRLESYQVIDLDICQKTEVYVCNHPDVQSQSSPHHAGWSPSKFCTVYSPTKNHKMRLCRRCELRETANPQ